MSKSRINHKVGDVVPDCQFVAITRAIRDKNQDREQIIGEVRAFVDSFEGSVPTVSCISKEMYVSTRTFNRRMKEAGITYREIVESSRKDKAIEYLARPGLRISDVSALLGYRDASNFTKAFKKWFGCGPCKFRKENISGFAF